MSVVNISFDIESQEVVLSINGVVTSAKDVAFEKFVFDGEKFVNFSYTVEVADANGLTERRQFFLPAKAMVGVDVDERGLSSKILHDDEKAKADVIDFMTKNRE